MRDSWNLNLEEAEEMRYRVRSAFREGLCFWCDKRCSDTALRFWQFASVVVDEGEKARTITMCQQCYNESLTAQGLAPLKN